MKRNSRKKRKAPSSRLSFLSSLQGAISMVGKRISESSTASLIHPPEFVSEAFIERRIIKVPEIEPELLSPFYFAL